jgi:hypothetical protein
MACQPKGETSNRNRGFQVAVALSVTRHSTPDPCPDRQPCQIAPDGGTPPKTAAPIFPRQSTINYLLSTSSYRLVHPRVCQFRPPNLLSHNALQPIPTVAWGAPAYPKTRKPKTQNPSKMPAIKPHQTASTGGGSQIATVLAQSEHR